MMCGRCHISHLAPDAACPNKVPFENEQLLDVGVNPVYFKRLILQGEANALRMLVRAAVPPTRTTSAAHH